MNTHGAWRCIDSYADGDTTLYIIGGNYIYGDDNEGIIIRDSLIQESESDEARILLQPGQQLELVHTGSHSYVPVVHGPSAPIIFYPGRYDFEELVRTD